MQLKSCLFILTLILVLSAYSQGGRPEGKPRPMISGSIIDGESGEAVPYAAISIHALQDSSIVKGGTSDGEGKFAIPVRPGQYFGKVQFLSYKTYTTSSFRSSPKGYNLGQINLEQDVALLNEVEIVAEKQQAEFKLDKRIYNVGKDINNAGGNASDILDNVPSVEVDVDGNVSLRGNDNVRILIDGKPSGLIGISSADALRQLQSNLIEKVEVITNPGAKFDAEGEVGIINIVLKKKRENGFNANMDFFTGSPDNHGLALNMNFRQNHYNIFASAGGSYVERPGNGIIYQEFILEDTTFVFENFRTHNRAGLGGNFRVGSEFFLSKTNTLSFSGLYSRKIGDNSLDLIYNDFDELGDLYQRSDRNEVETETTDNIEFDVNYRLTFPKNKDRLFTIDIKKQERIDIEDATISQIFSTDADAILLQRSDNTENESNWLFQTDYVHPIGEDGRLEMGVRATLRQIENNFAVEQFDEEAWGLLPGFFNDLAYSEDILASYLTWGDDLGKFSYQTGLRLEYTGITTELKLTNESNPREFLNLFPSTHVSYDYSEQSSIQASYSRRINRPRFWNLVPFYGFGDQRNFYSGNPDLNPEFINSVEFGHLTQSKKGSILFSLYGREKDGVTQRIVSADSAGTFTRPINLGTSQSLGLELSGSRSFKKWWRLNGSLNLYREIIDGEFEGVSYDTDTYAWNTRLSSKWTIKKNYDLQSSFRYRSPRQSPQGQRKSTYSLDLGVSKDIMKGKGTLTLNARDIFNTRKRRGIVDQPDYYSETEFQWRSRSIRLNFNYRINQKKKRQGRGGAGGDFDSEG